MKAQSVIPRWQGFNLLEMFTVHSDGNFQEDDFRWISEWGFDFVRIPACYTLWIENDDVYKLHEPMLEKMDRLVRLGEKYGLHVCLNFHRAPGFSVNPERQEPFNLWKDEEALAAFIFHWETFTRRYKGISSDQLSFNLVNEPVRPTPDGLTRLDHERVMRATVAAIREIDPHRLIILDGVSWGNETLPELVDLNIVQSCRAYLPMGVSHYKARWVNGENWPEPTWPGIMPDGKYWDRRALEAHYQAWAEMASQGVGVHCGEGGAYQFTPHSVTLAWLRDVLEILTSHNIGWALWNFRGSFGIMDSGRKDVAYVDWHGHRLDQQMLDLLRSFRPKAENKVKTGYN
jgi:endoglucanase